MQATFSISSRRFDWVLRLVLIGAVAAAFWPVLQASFVNWDDGVNITENPHLALTWENLCWMFSDTSYVPRYLPLGWLSYAVDLALFGPSPLSYHAGNMLLHALNTLLLYAIIKQILALWAMESGVISRQGAAAAAALWWAVNPLRTETVAWASSRIYCVAALCFFLALWFYLRQRGAGNIESRRDLGAPVNRNRGAVWLAAFCFALSLLTYPIALGGLAVFVVLDLLLGRLPPQFKQWWLPQYRTVWAEKLFFIIPILFAFYANWVTVTSPEKVLANAGGQFGAAAHAMQALWVWAWYVWKPWFPLDLAPRYPDLLGEMLFTSSHCAAALLVLGITAVVLVRRRLWPALLAAWICYLALLAPFTGVTQHPHYTYDRYSYIVGGVWALLIAMALTLLMRRKDLLLPLTLSVLLVCGFSAWQARQQTFIWNNSLNLHTWTAEAIGNHPEAADHEITTARLLRLLERPEDALASVRRAVAFWPENASAWALFGDFLTDQNPMKQDQAIASYQRALKLNPQIHLARQNLGTSLALAGRHEEAVIEFTKLLRRNPANPSMHRNLALSLEKLGRKAEAEKHLERAQSLEREAGSGREPGSREGLTAPPTIWP